MTSGPAEEPSAGLPGNQDPGGMSGQPPHAPDGGPEPAQPPVGQPAAGQPQPAPEGGPQPPPGQPGPGEPGSTWAYGPPPVPSPGGAGWPGQGGTSAGSRRWGRRLGLLAGGVAALLVVGAAGGFIGDAIGSSGATAAGRVTPGRFPGRPGGGFGSGNGFGGVPAGGSGQFPSGGSGQFPAGGSGQFPSGGSFPSGGASAGSGPANAAAIASRVDPGLVDVNITVDYGQARGAGTGMVLTSSGVVLTNNHVIDGATSISVTDVGNGRTYQAHVAGYDLSRDVAILQLSGAANLQTVTIARSGVSAGQRVVAIGNAGGTGGTPSYAGGTITATGQSITAADSLSGTSERLTGMIETNAGIQAGDSGGPLVNSSGQVIGMDTAGAQTFQSAQQATDGFAIPISAATHIATQILSTQPATGVHTGPTAFLGIQIAQGTSSGASGSGFGGGSSPAAGSGVQIAGVVSGSPAARAGLTAGDVITSVGGHPATSQPTLQHIMVTDVRPGQNVTVGYTSGSGQQHSATVVLASGPPA